MKPNNNQIETIKVLKTIISSWEKTNDIDSPTHEGDIDEEVLNLDFLTEIESGKINANLTLLYYTIRKIK